MHLFQQLPIVDKNQLSTLYKAIQLSLPTLLFFGMVALATASPHAYCFEYEEFRNKADTSEPKIEEVFRVVEEMPRFPGCEEMDISDFEKKTCAQQKLLEFIYQEVKYPEEAKENKVSGMTIVSFIVEKDGSVSNVDIVRDIGGGCGAEAARVVKLMNERGKKWVPGKQSGRKVRVQFNIPVKFHLSDDKTKSKADTSQPKSEEIFKVVDEMPRFPGCEEMDISDFEKKTCAQQKLLEFIYQEVKYPEEAKENKVSGMTIVSFIVEKDGSVSNVDIVRDIGAGCGAEAVRVVELMNERGIQWIPGKQRGRKVRVQFNLPVKFALNDDETKSKPDFDKIKKAKEDPDYVFAEAEEMPLPVQCKGSSKSMDSKKRCTREVIETARTKHYNYPKSAKKQGIKGPVLVEFIIEKDGSISNEKVVRSMGSGLDEEALNIVRAMHEEDLKWTPGKIDGNPVRTKYFISIPFK